MVDFSDDDRSIVHDEEDLVRKVEVALANAAAHDRLRLDLDSVLVHLRDLLSEAKPDDVAPLVEQMHRVAALRAAAGRGFNLPVDPMSPYFGHLRLKEDGSDRDVLLGKRGFIDRERGVLIVDWRNAPVSRLYYRYGEGDDYEESFGGVPRSGHVLARRAVSVHGGDLRRVSCQQGTFVKADGHWTRVRFKEPSQLAGGRGTAVRPEPGLRQLGVGDTGAPARSDKHLPEIAALIDRKQFELITRPDSGVAVLQGGAGSGKTTVALHRAAYLFYNAPDRYKPQNALVVVLSKGLVSYIAQVLPSLDVPGVPVTTFTDWVRKTRQRVLPRSPNLYIEDTSSLVARLKKHPVMLRAAEALVAEQTARAEAVVATIAPDHPEAERLRARWAESAGQALLPRLREMRATLAGGSGERLSGQVRYLFEHTFERLWRELGDGMADWAELVTNPGRLERCAAEYEGTARALRRSELDELVAWTSRQLDTVPEGRDDREDEQDFGIEQSVDPEGRLDPFDDALILTLQHLKWGGLYPGKRRQRLTYDHIVIDEAQDFSPVEVKVLLDAAGDRRSVTMAGDVAQKLLFDNSFEDWETLLADVRVPATHLEPLRLSYRSTAEVTELARAVLGPLADPVAPVPTRGGAPVELFRFEEAGEGVAFLAENLRSLLGREPDSSVALIGRTPEVARFYYLALRVAEVPFLRHVVDQDFTFRPGIDVTDVAQVKGLEYDYVVLLEATDGHYPDTVESRHLLHIGATRAAHQLWLTASAAPSSLLPAWLLAG